MRRSPIKCFILLAFGSICLLPLRLTAIDNKPATNSEDYEYYKKYGQHSKQWDDYVKQGFDAYEQQNCDQSMSALKQAVAAQCQDGLVYYKLAVCSEVAGTPYTALQYYQLAEEKLNKLQAPHHYQSDLNESYGRALFQAKRFDEAFTYLTRAATIGNPSFGLYYMVGFLYAKKNDVKAAVEYFDKALAQDTSQAPPAILETVYREVAKSYAADKNYQKSAELLSKALAIDPNDQEAQQIRRQISSFNQQQSILRMIQSAEDTAKGSNDGPPPKALPPAAAKLPPLDSQTLKDPTPPLGSAPGPANTSGTATTLQPLPPLPPAK